MIVGLFNDVFKLSVLMATKATLVTKIKMRTIVTKKITVANVTSSRDKTGNKVKHGNLRLG
jgi:hypothetical protein